MQQAPEPKPHLGSPGQAAGVGRHLVKAHPGSDQLNPLRWPASLMSPGLCQGSRISVAGPRGSG